MPVQFPLWNCKPHLTDPTNSYPKRDIKRQDFTPYRRLTKSAQRRFQAEASFFLKKNLTRIS